MSDDEVPMFFGVKERKITKKIEPPPPLPKKKIVIDEHSGRILADVDLGSMEEEPKPKKAAPVKRAKKVA